MLPSTFPAKRGLTIRSASSSYTFSCSRCAKSGKDRADMFAAHVTTFSVNFNWIKNERRKLETVLMKYPRYKDMFMDVARFISLKFKKRAEIYLAIL